MNTNFTGLRIALIVLFILFLLVGIGLALVSVTQNMNYNVTTNAVVCHEDLSSKLIPYQVVSFSCSMSKNSWLTFTLTSPANVTALIFFNSTGTSNILLNQTSNSFLFTFPTFVNGTLGLLIDNAQNAFVPVKGSASVNIAKPTVVSLPITLKPYVDEGYFVVALSGAALFMLIWNPNKVTTRFLSRLEEKFKRNSSIVRPPLQTGGT
jgi:hypothetical protein